MKQFIGLITKCKDEYFVEEFCNYYLNEGIDHIYIIDDNSLDQSIYENIRDNKKITITSKDLSHELTNKEQMKSIDELYQEVKNKFEWMIAVDIDEFIATKKNAEISIKEELQTTFKDVDYIVVPWVNMSCASRKKSPKSILQEITYRWNYNKKHLIPSSLQRQYTKGGKTPQKFKDRYNKIEVKPIFRTNAVEKITTSHFSEVTKSKVVKIVDSIELKLAKSRNPFYNNLREEKIAKAYLLCYHYRIISLENSLNKIKHNVFYKHYKPAILMSHDYPEIIDETLKYRSIRHKDPSAVIPKKLVRNPSTIEKVKLWHKKRNILKHIKRLQS